MGDETIQTDVDRLINILKTKKNMGLSQLAKELKVPEETIQIWVDFLVEEKIIAIDYNFTKPIISLLNRTKGGLENDLSEYKKNFKNNNLKNKNAEFMWKQHILKNLEQMKPFFFTQAEERDFENIDPLWEEYKEKVTRS